MAYSTPRTWVAGEIATAANLNTYLRDNIAWLATDAPTCYAYSTGQTIATGGFGTAVTFGFERWDNASLHSVVTNTERITVPSGGDGKYLFGFQVNYAAAAGNLRQSSFYVGASAVTVYNHYSGSNAIDMLITGHNAWSMAAADYAYFNAYQNSGGNLAISGGKDGGPEFWAFWFRT